MDLRSLKDVGLNAEQVAVRRRVEQFAQERMAPVVEEYERRGTYPRELVHEIAAQGYLGALVPPASGGLGLDYVAYGIVVEELARVDRVCASLVHVQNSLLNSCLLTFGTTEQRERYLPRLARGEWLSAACFTEPEVGSDLAAVQTHARRDGDGYILNGRKVYISHAEVADLFFVLATVRPGTRRAGTVALLVERAWPGVVIEPIAMRTLKRGSICAVEFHDVGVPAVQRLSDEGEGLRVSSANLDMGRYSVAAQALGQAQAALDAALDWARTREQFGQLIGRMQLIQQKLADAVMAVDTARLLVYRVGHLKNQGVARVSMEAAMAKCYASEVATRVALDAIQILGARGLSEQFAVSRIPLESKVLQIAEGSNEIQRTLISDYALGFRRQS